jgi:toxin ParE1/3/4
MSRSGAPLVLRERADSDIAQAVEYYLADSADAALGFLASLERAFGLIAQSPAAGSTRYATLLDIPGLRFRVCMRYPYLVFYLEQIEHIDVWRVLHAQRDLPAHLEFQ